MSNCIYKNIYKYIQNTIPCFICNQFTKCTSRNMPYLTIIKLCINLPRYLTNTASPCETRNFYFTCYTTCQRRKSSIDYGFNYNTFQTMVSSFPYILQSHPDSIGNKPIYKSRTYSSKYRKSKR